MHCLLPLFFAILGLTLTSCSLIPCSDSTEVSPMPSIGIGDSAQVTSIVQELAVEVKNDQHLWLENAKTYYENGLKSIQLNFISQDIIEMCGARKMIVDVTENLLAKMSQNDLIRSQLVDYPPTASNLEIYILFESYFGKYVDPYYIAWIALEDGVVYYYTFDLTDSTKDLWHCRREPYGTSREIAFLQRASEDAYEETHRPPNFFGNERYFPPLFFGTKGYLPPDGYLSHPRR